MMESIAHEEEIDYLDDRFIQESAQPKLVGTKRRLNQGHCENTEPFKRPDTKQARQSRMHKRLVEGLNQPISSENVGFKILAKMGFREGKGIGKNEDGRTEPVPLMIKKDKSGLESTNKSAKYSREAEQISTQTLKRSNYRARKSSEHELRKLRKNLEKARSIIRSLDEKDGVSEHELWNTEGIEVLSAEEVRLNFQDSLDYLRNTKNYCLWCSIHYESLHDLESNCPGLTDEEH